MSSYSTLVPISEAVTVLVGKNESGKTAFLEALHKALDKTFKYIEDYARIIRSPLQKPQTEAVFCGNVAQIVD